MKQPHIIRLLPAAALLALAACEDTDYQLYDTGQKDSAYIEYIDDNDQEATSVNYAFGFAGDRELIQRERLVPFWRRVEGIQPPVMTPQDQQRRESAPGEQAKPSPASPRPRLR